MTSPDPWLLRLWPLFVLGHLVAIVGTQGFTLSGVWAAAVAVVVAWYAATWGRLARVLFEVGLIGVVFARAGDQILDLLAGRTFNAAIITGNLLVLVLVQVVFAYRDQHHRGTRGAT